MSTTQPKMYTAQQVQDELGISRPRVNQLAAQHGLGTFVGQMKLYSREELEVMRSRQTKPGPPAKSQEDEPC